ncbi:MAG: EVE domain-containing protein [Chlorobi bacterium CHB2]|nr:EVE domain-containing protein [Chlorobi bacterium CHB2]
MPASSRKFWLLKSEPDCYSIDDLQRDGQTFWSGVRNYQARNFMRDQMELGDGVLFYHSSTEPPCVVGLAEVCRRAYPDFTALDPDDDHFDPKHTPDNPIWMMVDVRFVRKFGQPITLAEIKATPGLEAMVLTQRGSRLSVQPVTAQEWEIVTGMRD